MAEHKYGVDIMADEIYEHINDPDRVHKLVEAIETNYGGYTAIIVAIIIERSTGHRIQLPDQLLQCRMAQMYWM